MTDATPGASPTIADLEARVGALSALIKSLLTTLMLRGLLTRPEIAPLVAEAEVLMAATAAPAAQAELRSVEEQLPAYLREAVGPAPSDDEHDH